MSLLTFLMAAALASPPATAGAPYTAVEVVDAGSLRGRVVVGEPPPPFASYPVTKDRSVCGRRAPDERLVLAPDGGLANAVVSLEAVTRGKPIDTLVRARLENSGCRFVPHVMAVAVGQTVDIVNADPILHSTHAKLNGVKTVFNVALPVQNQKIPRTISRPGAMKLQCDAGHTWMSAWIVAFEHPYFAVTGEDGSFAIEGIPPGTYRVRAWHEELGGQVRDVVVPAGAVASVTFDALARREPEPPASPVRGSRP